MPRVTSAAALTPLPRPRLPPPAGAQEFKKKMEEVMEINAKFIDMSAVAKADDGGAAAEADALAGEVAEKATVHDDAPAA